MTHVINLINIKLVAILIIAAIIVSLASTALALVDDVVERQAAMPNQDLTVLEHKLYLQENSSPVDDGLDAIEYEHSQKAKEIANANAKLAKLKASVNGGDK